MRFSSKISISRKILLGILPLFLLFVAVSVILQNRFQEQELMEEAQINAITAANIIKESMVSMMVNNLEVDTAFLKRLNELEHFDSVHIVVNNLRLREELMTPERRKRHETQYQLLKPDWLEQEVMKLGQPSFTREGDRFRAVVPFNATDVCQKCHSVPIGYTLGAADLQISFVHAARAAEENWTRSIIIFLSFSVLAIAVASIMFSRFVRNPINRLVVATTEISNGRLDYEIAPPHEGDGLNGSPPADELKFLALKFDQMRNSLREKIQQIDDVNRNLAERNAEVEDALQRLRCAQEELVRSERLAVSGRMTAQLSHEINNPIHNVESLLESSLKRLPADSEIRELINVALEEVLTMARLTRQLLDFSKASVIEVNYDLVDIGSLLDEVSASNRESLAKQRIALAMEIPSPLSFVHGSRDKLKQVFLNLMINARDAITPPGTITLRAERSGDMVRIRIIDTGHGIEPENLDKVFDAFFTTKKEVSGVGLGLFVSYWIVQQHKGTIHVKSSVGKGTTLTVELPAVNETYGENG